MNITVYLGASEVDNLSLNSAATELGQWIGSTGHTLVYGGSKMGLMGRLATGAINAGGHVIGVEPQMFMDDELQLDILPELIVTTDMAERKLKMIELGDAFIAFPGGTGTLEEISEVMSALSLGLIDSKCIFYNLDGYYDHMKAHLNNMLEYGLSTPSRLAKVYFASDLPRNRKKTEQVFSTLMSEWEELMRLIP